MNNLDRYLQSIGKQEERTENEIIVIKNSKLEEIIKIYNRWALKGKAEPFHSIAHMEKTMRKTEYDAKDIAEFCFSNNGVKGTYEQQYFGQFLSVLINKCQEENIEIITAHLETKINYVSFWGGNANKKNVVVKGNSGNFTGYCMKNGKLTIQGNSEDYTGYYMTNGELILEGNTGHYTGMYMRNGIIRVSGSIKGISEYWKGGKIYEKGILVRGAE